LEKQLSTFKISCNVIIGTGWAGSAAFGNESVKNNVTVIEGNFVI